MCVCKVSTFEELSRQSFVSSLHLWLINSLVKLFNCSLIFSREFKYFVWTLRTSLGINSLKTHLPFQRIIAFLRELFFQNPLKVFPKWTNSTMDLSFLFKYYTCFLIETELWFITVREEVNERSGICLVSVLITMLRYWYYLGLQWFSSHNHYLESWWFWTKLQPFKLFKPKSQQYIEVHLKHDILKTSVHIIRPWGDI